MTHHVEESGYEEHSPAEHNSYEAIHRTAEFAELRKRHSAFVLPVTFAFLGWYLLYVVLSNWAPGFMGTKVVGNINVALVFGLLQFASTFVIAWAYSRYMNAKVDPIARDLEARFHGSANGGAR